MTPRLSPFGGKKCSDWYARWAYLPLRTYEYNFKLHRYSTYCTVLEHYCSRRPGASVRLCGFAETRADATVFESEPLSRPAGAPSAAL
jgi:hypothetical protein